MPKPATLARPQKPFPILQEAQIICNVDPVRVLLREQHARFSCLGIRKQQFQLSLLSIEPLDRQPLGVAQPIHARNVLIRLRAGVHQLRPTAADTHTIDVHDRIVPARHRVPLLFRIPVIRSKIHQRIP
jgi:hypothetical protein